MAALPPIRRLLIDDFASQKSWISNLLVILNNFTESVVNALNSNLTIVENMSGDIKTVTMDAVTSSISWTKRNLPVAVLVGNVTKQDGTTLTLTAAVQVQWSMSSDNKSLMINNIVGVTPTSSTQYIVNLICFTG